MNAEINWNILRNYYSELANLLKNQEETQKGSLDITRWLDWFLNCLNRAIISTETKLSTVMKKARFWEVHSGHQFNNRQQNILNILLDHFEGKLTSSKWAKMAKCSQDTALRDIQDLMERNILLKDAAGGRSTGYLLNGNF